ncbi:MAG: hypothetical protein M1814_004249 [Vezdaea aestivalis]|nr:MAG: hypothetical protein M1814_004249 [Vezdaea aestivalis]
MHSALVRLQNVFGFFTTVVFCVAALVSLSVILYPQNPSATISLRNVQVARGRPHYYSTKREEYATVKFDLDADLNSLFNWNTKQLFIWVTATWPPSKAGPNTPFSEAVIWDQIIPAAANQNPNLSLSRRRSRLAPPTLAERGKLKLKNQKAKYQINDVKGKIANVNNATLSLHWNVQPWVGALLWKGSGSVIGAWKDLKGGTSEAFDFPAIKVPGDKGKAAKA